MSILSITTRRKKSNLPSLSIQIFNNPETKFEEFKACELLSNWLESRGWKVSRGVYGLKTAFEAQFSVVEGGRTVCFNAEYGECLLVPPHLCNTSLSKTDALPDLGHACGHNLIAISSLASAISLEHVLKTHHLPGTVVVMGTPGEESGGGKWIMAKNGAWNGFDACVMTHGMRDFSTPLCLTKASWKLRARFHGLAAHAATAPWRGLNACDAIVHAYSAISMLRQHLEKGSSIQGCILEAGKASNIIPDYAEGLFSIRAPTMQKLGELKSRFEPIFDAAAAATGCSVALDW
jgi:amidohydrolase